ncbi:hypothetical protein ACJRO7_022411 [Eucalyptus globulus]|uniref:Uncharacterized protein n=1 Tax=Eucalyptus globulus TaxID=34317 RepID=A0ABD3JYB6_EUCGL
MDGEIGFALRLTASKAPAQIVNKNTKMGWVVGLFLAPEREASSETNREESVLQIRNRHAKKEEKKDKPTSGGGGEGKNRNSRASAVKSHDAEKSMDIIKDTF